MPATFTDLLPPTKYDPTGTAFDWTPGSQDAGCLGSARERKAVVFTCGRKHLAALGALVAAGRV